MKRDMRAWAAQVIANPRKSAIPILSFPCVSLLDIEVTELTADPDMQAKGMKLVADRVPSGAAVSMMDLSVEAEAFGATVRFYRMKCQQSPASWLQPRKKRRPSKSQQLVQAERVTMFKPLAKHVNSSRTVRFLPGLLDHFLWQGV